MIKQWIWTGLIQKCHFLNPKKDNFSEAPALIWIFWVLASHSIILIWYDDMHLSGYYETRVEFLFLPEVFDCLPHYLFPFFYQYGTVVDQHMLSSNLMFSSCRVFMWFISVSRFSFLYRLDCWFFHLNGFTQ